MARHDDRLRIEVLGPIRVLDDQGRDVTPAGVLQRRLLALLVLRRDRTVSIDAAIEVLWPVKAPRDPVGSLHNQVFRLRRSLPAAEIESTGDGYRLMSSRIELDAEVLADALLAGEADPDVAAVVDAALAAGRRGPAYPELGDLDDGRAEATRLDELRVRALEARAARQLAAGESDGLIAELAALAEAEPLRERPRALLMAALAHAGRHAEALRVYDDFRRLLGDELGIEPSPSLAGQHADLLSGSGAGGWAPAGRLPWPATSLLGRGALVDELDKSLDTARVVTLVGPGGVGKTRLAIEVGHRLAAARADRPVVMCELASASVESAIDIVATAFGIDARAGVEPVERMAAVLGGNAVVLILDNCEHVLGPVSALVERLISSCPSLTVLATSRERLRVAGEVVRVVPTLPWDADDAPALRLFMDRARAVAPDFEPDERELAGVADIVRHLDGLPLAIELAAALLHTHDIAEISAGLDQRFALLSSGYRSSARHGSLSAAVSWSYERLDDHLRRAFADVSVFVGPFTATDAAAICGVDPASISNALAQLSERSLVMRAPGRRYVLLETLRAFGAERLEAEHRVDAVGDRHAQHQVEWLEQAGDQLLEDGLATMGDIDAAIPDLRAGLGWLLDHDRVEDAGRLVAALYPYGFLRQRPDVMAWAQRVTDVDPDDRSPMAARVWAVSAYAAWMVGDMAEAGARGSRALRACEQIGGTVPAVVATFCGSYELFEGRLDEAVRWYRRAADEAHDDPARRLIAVGSEVLARAYAGDPAAFALADDLLAEIGDAVTPLAAYVWYCAGEAELAGDVDRAHARLSRAIELAELTGASFVSGLAGASRASIDARLGDPLVAAEEYRRLIGHWRRSGVWSTQWTMLRSIAVLLDRLGRPRDAAVLEGAVRATSAGHRIFGADESALAELGARLRARLGEDDYDAARREGGGLDGDAAAEHALRAL